jgi:predicted HD phosphohydrolase
LRAWKDGGVSETDRVEATASSLDDVVDVLKAAPGYDLTEGDGIHHDLLDHSLQTAAVLRTSYPEDLELQLAGLVHDIGHILWPRLDEVHASVAAAFVRPVMGERIAELVRLHVPAKRYLVTTEPEYGAALDRGSIVSMERQGGAMTGPEIRDFEAEPLCADAVVLRRADEAGKVPGRSVPGLESWLAPLLTYEYRRERR